MVKSANPKARIQALCALDGIRGVTGENLIPGLSDPHPLVRANAIRVSEAFLRQSGSPKSALAFENALLALAADTDIRVRYQLAFSLGEWADPRGGEALARIALQDRDNAPVQVAVMSSAPKHLGKMLTTILGDENPPAGLVEHLLALAVALDDQKVFSQVLAEISGPRNGSYESWQFAALAGLLDALDRRGQTLAQLQDRNGGELKQVVSQLEPLFARAREAAAQPSTLRTPWSELRLLGRDISQADEDIARLGELLSPQISGEIQRAALSALRKINRAKVAETLVGRWSRLGPGLRAEAIGLFFIRSGWLDTLLGALEQGRIPAGQIAAPQQQQLLNHKQREIRQRASRLFHVNADRQKILQAYTEVETLKGDPAKGRALFQQTCAACHRLKEEGNAIGPDLGMMSDKPVSDFLIAILDPNRSVEVRYVNYTALLKNEREISGVIVTETANSITLKNSSGPEETVLRSDLQDLRSSGLSLMPEGLENAFKPQDLADLISFVRSR